MARVRLAGAQDVLRIVDMIARLQTAVSGPVPVDRAWTARTVAGLISDPDGYVAVTDAGFISGSLRPTIINPARIAVEHGWFAADGSGLRLLRGFEAWARERGATLIQLSTGPEGLDLTRLDYRRAEIAWVK